MSNLSDFVGGNSIYPRIDPATGYVGAGPRSGVAPETGSTVQGFAGDGDYIALPVSNTASITLTDNLGNASVAGAWSGGIVPADIDAAADVWCGFMLDATDSLLYVMVADTTASPDEYLLASVDAAGAILTYGAFAAPTTAFSNAPSWIAFSDTIAAANLYRAADGAGNFFLRGNTGNEMEQLEFTSAGAIVGDVTSNGRAITHYKNPNGVGIGSFTSDSGNSSSVLVYVSNTTKSRSLTLDMSIGISAETGACFAMQWAGFVVIASGSNIATGPRAYDVSAFDSFTDSLGSILGIT